MMRYLDIQIIICCFLILPQVKVSLQKNPSTRCKRNNENDNVEASESRRSSKNPYSDRTTYTKEDYEKQGTDLPVAFQAPTFHANDYWRYNHEESNYDTRRTFFKEYSQYDKRSTYPNVDGFYQFMSSLFTGRESTSTPEIYHHSRGHPTHPYPYDGPYGYAPTEPNYIPPPKPIRASVIKLETITRSPNYYPPFDFETTTKYHPHYGNILNHVLIEKSKHQDYEELGFHHHRHRDDPIGKVKYNANIPPHVLPKPVYVPPTTLRPSLEYSKFFHNHTSHFSSKKRNQTPRKYPSSIQDQLPPLDGDVKIPYISATTIPFIVTTIPSEKPRYSGRIVFPNEGKTTNGLRNILDVRDIDQIRTKSVGREPLTAIDSRGPNIELDTTTFIYPVQKIRGSLHKKQNPSVEIITNLTLEGLSKSEKENANIHNYVNFFNMSNLINYERTKLQNIPQSDWNKFIVKNFENKTPTPTVKHFVNLNDELSLDAKILKDTNWDGIITSKIPPTVPFVRFQLFRNQTLQQTTPKSERVTVPKNLFKIRETTSNLERLTLPTHRSRIKETTTNWEHLTVTTHQPEVKETTTEVNLGIEPRVAVQTPLINFNKTRKETFWVAEIPKTTTTEVSFTEVPKTTEVVTAQTEYPTTTDLPVSSTSIPAFTETTEALTTTLEVSTFRTFGARRTERIVRYTTTTTEPTKTTAELPSIIEIFETTTTTTAKPSFSLPRRKYVRRPKIQSFTPYPTTSELQKKTINRNNFPKRQKPNITLAFGNKNIIKPRETYTRDEVMKFSDEDIKKRKRKIGKRRQLYKRVRTTTTEQPLQEE